MNNINLEDEEQYYWEGFGDGSSVLKELVAERDAVKAENEKLREALQGLVNDLEDYPAVARLLDTYEYARAALGEKE